MRKNWKTWRMWITGHQIAGAIRHPAEAAARKTPRIIIRGMTREAEIPAAVRRGKITRMEVPEEAEAPVSAEPEEPAEEEQAEEDEE